MERGGNLFAFEKAARPQQLMDELEKFILFWHGPRRAGYGEPESALATFPLPYPLKRLYAFAGRWPPSNPDYAAAANAFCVQDALRPSSGLGRSDDGKVVFLDENQGNWTCATLPEGDDPPVWVEDVFEVYRQGRWGLVTPSLSRFLVTFCLQESLFGAKFCVSDETFTALFESSKASAVPLWLNGPYAYSEGTHNFYLLHESVLVGVIHGSAWLAANDDKGVAFLTAHESEIVKLGFTTPSSWSLDISRDGSGRIGVMGWSDSGACFPAGTFDFEPLRDRLLGVSTGDGDASVDFVVFFQRAGRSYARGMFVHDAALVSHLFRQALNSVTTREADFEKMLGERPPLA